MHLVLTDSGLGGLAICAGLEGALRRDASHPRIRLTYVNAWPEEGRGYNDLPDLPARAHVFDAVLHRIDAMAPDAIIVACNTLSILYEMTRRRECHDGAPVHGIIEAGVTLFEEALRRESSGVLVLVGTRTTIESGVHRDRLVARGVAPARIGAASCHGLATAIEDGPASDATEALLATCAMRASAAAPPGEPLCLGLCCTHYGMVADRVGEALARCARRRVEVLDPNQRLVDEFASRLRGSPERGSPERGAMPEISVEVVSKVVLSEHKRDAVAAVLESTSPATARALRAYVHVPDLF